MPYCKYLSPFFLILKCGVLVVALAGSASPAKAAGDPLATPLSPTSPAPSTPPPPREPSMPKDPYQSFVYTDANGATLPYLLLPPDHLEPGKKYPIVLFFHGAGERGIDNVAQLRNGIWAFTKKRNLVDYPAFILAPQCPKGKQWVDMPWGAPSGTRPPEPSANMTLALAVLEKVCADQPVDTDRIYVAGLSMGGYAVWDCITRFPEKFAAGVAVCGGGDENTVTAEVAKIPVWAFASDDDPIVPVGRSRGMIAAMKTAGGNPHYTEYHGYNHASWVLPTMNKNWCHGYSPKCWANLIRFRGRHLLIWKNNPPHQSRPHPFPRRILDATRKTCSKKTSTSQFELRLPNGCQTISREKHLDS